MSCNLFVSYLNFSFSGARSEGFAQLRNVSKLHPECEISQSSLIYEEAIIITSGRIKEEIIITSGLPRV